MATWRDIAADNEGAARELFASGRWRSCVSRAYYAVYSGFTHQLARQGVRLHGAGRGNPARDALPNLAARTLRRLKPDERRRLRRAVGRLYAHRVSAGCFPGHGVDPLVARTAVAEMTKAMNILEGRKGVR